MPTTGRVSDLSYSYPVADLPLGHSHGNRFAYVTLDAKTDVVADPSSVRYGLRESTNQQYYLSGWEVRVFSADGQPFEPVDTTLAVSYQETRLERGSDRIRKRFFLPFATSNPRSAHFLLAADTQPDRLRIHSRAQFPAEVEVVQSDFEQHRYVAIRFVDGTTAVLWGSESPVAVEVRRVREDTVEVACDFQWHPAGGATEFAISFAYVPRQKAPPLGAIVDPRVADAPSPRGHLRRVRQLLTDTITAINGYLNTCRLVTPDPVINRAYAWAKVNQLRDQQEYRWGSGFSNQPPSDIVVGRDTVWYLVGSDYYAQRFSRKLLDFWFEHGVGDEGKFVEYLAAARDPLFKDDYGLNINDNTPLFLLAAAHHYALTGDRAFLHRVYPTLLRTADYIIRQTDVGEPNHYGLVWCTTTETFVRGLCGWRNCIRDYTLSGAVTEVNVQCVQGLRVTADLADVLGDEANAGRLRAEANRLEAAIRRHLRSHTDRNPWYLLTIDPSGRPISDITGDLVFPVLYGVADDVTAREILRELFGERFWVDSDNGGGGIRTVSSAQEGFHPDADRDSYGLLGGVWPNLALWAAKAAADRGLPDLALKALRGTYLLSEPTDPSRYNVVPGQYPEYFNGDDLVQRGMPRSTFIPGILIWATIEGLAGVAPHPAGLRVNPVLPSGWEWIAVGDLPYRGCPVSFLALESERTLYTTMPVESTWRLVVVPHELQREFRLQSDDRPFWLVVPDEAGHDLLVAAGGPAAGRLFDRASGAVVAEFSLDGPGLARVRLRR